MPTCGDSSVPSRQRRDIIDFSRIDFARPGLERLVCLLDVSLGCWTSARLVPTAAMFSLLSRINCEEVGRTTEELAV